MKKTPVPNMILFIVVSLLFLFLGHSFVPQRTLINTSESMTIRGDAVYYTSMIEGNWTTAPSPYKFRVLVPFIASLLPFSPIDSLRLITYISLFLSYIFILLACEKTGLKIGSSIIGLASVWASAWHLYNYHNPFLTDALGLLLISIMMFALVNGSFFLFFIAAVLGVLSRETVIFLVPSCFARNEWRSLFILLIITSIAFIVVPRLILSSETDPTLFSTFSKVGVLLQPLSFAKNVFLSWGFVWIFSIIGIWYIPVDKYMSITLAYACLLAGAAFSSLIATDTGRMFSILTPALAIANAWLYAELNKRGRLYSSALVALFIFRALVSQPNILFDEGSRTLGQIRILLLILEVIYVLVVVTILWKSLSREVKEKATILFEFVKRFLVHTRWKKMSNKSGS